MKTATKLLVLLLTLAALTACISLLSLPASAETVASGKCGDNLTYTIDSEGTLTITGEGAMTNWSSLISAPWQNYKNSVITVVIGDQVTSIGDYAFFCFTSIKNVIFGNRVNSIGENAFFRCSALTEVTIPNCVTMIGRLAFDQCSRLNRVTIPDSVISIGDGAFSDCTSLIDVTIPESVTDIGGSVFWYCSSLVSIWIDPANPNYASEDGILYSKDKSVLICCPCGKAGRVTIPNGVTDIAENAFISCKAMTSVTIPNSVMSIGEQAFNSCTALKKVVIPDSVTSVGGNSFGWCSALNDVKIGKSMTNISDDMFSGCSSLTNLNIPEGITNIGNYAFSNCSALTGIIIPDSVTVIGRNAFYECKALSYVWIGDGVTNIETETFCSCTSLKDVIIGNRVAGIGTKAFGWCYALTDVTIPNSVTTIGKQAFIACSSLKNLELGNGVTKIGEAAFSSCDSLLSVQIPSSVTSIGNSAFSYSGLTDITIPDSVVNIGKSVFYQCSSLADIYCEANMKPSGWSADWNSSCYATVHWGWLSTERRTDQSFTNIRVSVYQNKNDAASQTDAYQVAADVTITILPFGKQIETDVNGNAIVPKAKSYTFSKSGYVFRTLTVAQLEESPLIYLQKESENAPVISAVWVGDIDVLTKSFGIPKTETAPTSFKAEIDWGSSSAGSIRLVQESRAVSFSGTSAYTVLNQHFDTFEPIYVEATDASGRKTKKKLNLVSVDENNLLEGSIGQKLNGFKFDWGESLSVSFPDSGEAEFFKDEKIKLAFPTAIPVTYSVSDGKIYAAIGIDLVQYSSSDKYASSVVTGNTAHVLKREVTGFVAQCKDNFGKLKSAPKQFKTFWKSLSRGTKYLQGSFVFDADFTVIGYMEGSYDEQGNITWLDSGLVINPSVSHKWTTPFMAGSVPMFWEIAIKLDVEAKFNAFYINEIAKNYTPAGDISGELKLSGGLGVGVKKVLSFSGGLTGKLKADYKIYRHSDNYFKLTASLEAYVKVELLFFSYEPGPWKLTEGVWYETGVEAANAVQRDYLKDIYSADSYTLSDLSYLNERSYFVANEEKITVGDSQILDTSTVKDIAINTYRRSTPQYGILSDGRRIAVWLDSENDNINNIVLYYSLCDNGVWTMPEKVWEDGTTDYAPTLLCSGNEIYLIWQNATRAFDAESELSPDAISDSFDITVAIWGEDGFTAVTLPTDGLDTMPTLCAGNGGVYAVWCNNPDNSWFGEGNQNRIFKSFFDGESWSAPAVAYNGLYPIYSLVADERNGLRIAWSMDEDGDLSTMDDSRLYLNGHRVSDSTVAESAPAFLDHILYWYCDGVICSESNPVCGGSIESDNYQLFALREGLAAVYPVSDGLTSRLHISYFDPAQKCWSEGIALTEENAYIADFAGAVNDAGRLEILTNVFAVVGDMQSAEPYGSATLRLYGTNDLTDLELTDLWCDESTYCAGSPLWLNMELTNRGTTAVDSVTVEIFDEQDVLLNRQTLSVGLLPGETVGKDAYFIPAKALAGMEVTVKVTPTERPDDKPETNSASLSISYENVSVENLTTGVREDGLTAVTANIVNYGYAARENITVALRDGTANGEIVATQAVERIGSMDIAVVAFPVEAVNGRIYYVTLEDWDDSLSGDDSDFICLSVSSEPDLNGDVNGDGIVNIQDVTVLLTLLATDAPTIVAADVNRNGIVNIQDVTELLTILATG